MELDPFQLAVGCYPIFQIALYIYMAGHLPLAITEVPIVEAAKAVKLMKGPTFSPWGSRPSLSQASRDSQV